ncbi:MAG: ATP-binding protein [Planctomycetota bacterium]
MTWPYITAVVTVCLTTYAAGLWWVTQSTIKQQRDQAVGRLELLSDNLSSSIEPLLANGELSAVRRLIAETGYQQQLDSCKVLIGDGQTLVDANLEKPQLTVMPASWPAEQPASSGTRVMGDVVQVDRVVPIAGRGETLLALTSTLQAPTVMIRPALPGAALIGFLGLALAALVLRKMQGRLAVLTLIRGALRDAGEGMPDLSALTINPAWGTEAAGWNRLVTATQARQRAETEKTLNTLNTQRGSGGLEEVCEGMGFGIVLADTRGKVLYHNGSAVVCGLLNETLQVGAEFGPAVTEPALAEQVEEMIAGSGPGRIAQDIALGQDSDASTFRVILRRLHGSGSIVLTIEDVTQQRTAEASRHDFVSQATHELRTPLTNIRLYVETAQTDGEDDKELRGECLNVINRESQRLERLVSEMLSVSEIEAGSMTIRKDDVRLDQLFKSLEQDYKQNAAKKSIDLHFDLPPKLPAIQGDRDKLAIVVQNLLGNAIKYTPENGSVNVGVDLSATELNIELRDSGIGISEEDQQRVFEKFYRANDPRLGDITGSGLGLALAYEIIRLHGGDITVESVLNEGSTFRVTLPIDAEGV